MQLLILAHAQDAGAQAVAEVLAPLLDFRLTVLRPEWLGQANWSRQFDRSGQAHTQLCWRNGRRLDSRHIGMVWNRTRQLPDSAFRLGSPQDRNFAGAELQGLVASWLASLEDRVEPSVQRHASVTPALDGRPWTSVAGQCGLGLAPDCAATPDFTVLHTPLGLYGSAAVTWPQPLLHACHALADELGFALLALRFKGTPEEPRLLGVDVRPALAAAPEVQAVAAWLLHCINASERAGQGANQDTFADTGRNANQYRGSAVHIVS
jgi:hypothetical protein